MTATTSAPRPRHEIDADMVIAQRALDGYGERARIAMLESLPEGTPAEWLYDLIADYPNRAGKALRPTLLLATCEAFGADANEALDVAVALELAHNAFLIHDDIVDESLRRRGDPTLHELAGTSLALNAGDALGALAQRQLRSGVAGFSARLADAVCQEFETMLTRTTEGQAIELGWRRDNVVDLEPDDYLYMIMHKTCWYTTIHPLRTGALIGSAATRGPLGSAPAVDLDAMIRFGFYLGAVFQIRDDVLNLVGGDAYGKEIGGDLIEAKRTLMIIHLLRCADERERHAVTEFLGADRSARTEGRAAEVRAMMDRYDSIEFAKEYASGIATQAEGAFEAAFASVISSSSNPSADAVHALITYMHDRVL